MLDWRQLRGHATLKHHIEALLAEEPRHAGSPAPLQDAQDALDKAADDFHFNLLIVILLVLGVSAVVVCAATAFNAGGKTLFVERPVPGSMGMHTETSAPTPRRVRLDEDSVASHSASLPPTLGVYRCSSPVSSEDVSAVSEDGISDLRCYSENPQRSQRLPHSLSRSKTAMSTTSLPNPRAIGKRITRTSSISSSLSQSGPLFQTRKSSATHARTGFTHHRHGKGTSDFRRSTTQASHVSDFRRLRTQSTDSARPAPEECAGHSSCYSMGRHTPDINYEFPQASCYSIDNQSPPPISELSESCQSAEFTAQVTLRVHPGEIPHPHHLDYEHSPEFCAEDLIHDMGVSGLAMLDMQRSAGMTGCSIRWLLIAVAAQAWCIQFILLYYMSRILVPRPGSDKLLPRLIVWVGIYLHFITVVRMFPLSFSVLCNFHRYHVKTTDMAIAGIVFFMDAIFIPIVILFIGSLYMCTSDSVADVILNSCAVAFISDVDNYILSLNQQLNDMQLKSHDTSAYEAMFTIPCSSHFLSFTNWVMCVVPLVPGSFAFLMCHVGMDLMHL